MCTQLHKDIATGIYKASNDEEDQCYTNDPNYECFNAAINTKTNPGIQILIKGSITLNGQKPIPVQIMVDSGSTICMTNSRLVDKLKNFNLYPRQINNVGLIGTGKDEVPVNKEIQLPITITNGKDSINIKHTFLVIHSPIGYDCILGNDLLERVLDSINYKTKTVNFITNRKEGSFDKIIPIPLSTGKKNNESFAASISLLVRELYKTPTQSDPVSQLFTEGFIKLT